MSNAHQESKSFAVQEIKSCPWNMRVYLGVGEKTTDLGLRPGSTSPLASVPGAQDTYLLLQSPDSAGVPVGPWLSSGQEEMRLRQHPVRGTEADQHWEKGTVNFTLLGLS